VEPAARIFAEAHDEDFTRILKQHEHFIYLQGQTPKLAANDVEHGREKYWEYEGAGGILEQHWFIFDEDTRQTCLASVPEEKEGGEEGEKKDESGSGK
jgi:hypothetical protein